MRVWRPRAATATSDVKGRAATPSAERGLYGSTHDPVNRGPDQNVPGSCSSARIEPLADDRGDPERGPDRVAERRDDLLRPPCPEHGVETRSGAEHDRRAVAPRRRRRPTTGAGRSGRSSRPSGGRAVTPRQRAARRGRRERRAVRARDPDPVVGRGDLPGEGRAAEPDVVEIDQPPALGQVTGQPLAHLPGRDELGQEDVGQLAFDLERRRDRRPEGDPAADAPDRPEERQRRRLQRGLPDIDQLPTRELGCIRGACEHEAPALARRRRDLVRRRVRPGALELSRSGHPRLVVCGTMQEPAPPTPDAPAIDLARWAASLPPPPFVDPAAEPGRSRFVPLSPRVAVLIVAAIVIGLLFWMARDSVRPFVVGLLFVYLLDPPVRWLVRRGMRRSIAILIVYVVAIARLRRVPGPDADAAGQRDPALRRRLPEARREPRRATPAGSASSTRASRSRPRSASGSTASSPGSVRAARAAAAGSI